ncbi:MAG: bifunctional 2-C-methyl-D-erythritol 4-phosphate cytidylyltransferase/2-C-methyl-D-erythritol 2,4-cyclodiphosphate synthase [Sphingomonadaceae bacterium]
MGTIGERGDVAALIVAAGRGVRAGGETPKQYRRLLGRPMLAHAVDAFARHCAIGPIRLVVAPGEEARARCVLGALADRVDFAEGGETRQDSVRHGLESLAGDGPSAVLIHDAARPFVPAALIDRVLQALAEWPGACPALPVVDSLRTGDSQVDGEVDRSRLFRVQTPQGFRFPDILAAHRAAPPGATDDVAVARAAGLAVALVEGDERAMKVTHGRDFARAEQLVGSVTATGTGFDVHRFGPGDHLWLCGVKVPHTAGVIGHSDADVGLHALTDAILGALGEGDIGQHFPPSDPQWKGASSDRFLAHAAALVRAAGGTIDHVDVTIIAEAPKVGPHRAAMVARIGAILADHAPRVSVKATTTEGLGFTGRREGIAAQAAATIRLPRPLEA